MFHGSPQKVDTDQINQKRDRYDLCLCESRDVAEGYALQDSSEGYVHEIELDVYGGIGAQTVCDILDEQDVDRGDIGPDSPYFYLLLDRVDVQEALVDAGEAVVEYVDEDWSNEEHYCYRVLEAGHVDVLDVVLE